MTGGLTYPSASGVGGAAGGGGGGAKAPNSGSVEGQLLLQRVETQNICVLNVRVIFLTSPFNKSSMSRAYRHNHSHKGHRASVSHREAHVIVTFNH